MKVFYVYALKDPRSTPAKPFYVGKGTGSRAWEHALRLDQTRKGQRIREIHEAGHQVITTMLVEGVNESDALKLEAELISAFVTEGHGGILTNTVVPIGAARPPSNVIVPTGVVERAQIGLLLLKTAVLELAQANPAGITNAEAAKTLGLQSEYSGGSKDYLSWSVLGLLMREGKIVRRSPSRRHVAVVR
jgi:hypothetical protein